MENAKAIFQVATELKAATLEFGKFTSPHEGLAIIQEEFEELKEEVFKKSHVRDIRKMRGEAKQVAVTAIRFMIDLC